MAVSRPYLLVLALAFGCKPSGSGAVAVSVSPPEASEPREELDALVHLQDTLDAAERQGRELYVRDAIAATAGDALMATPPEQFPEGWIPRGWLTWLESDARRVDIIGISADGAPAVMLEVDVSGEMPASKVVDPPRPLTGEAQQRWQARELALTEYSPSCTPSVNPVVMPAGDQGWFVYLIPGTTDPSLRILGGHVQVWVGPDLKIREAGPLTKSCLLMKPNTPPGASMAALMVSHVLTDHPREHHVYASLMYGMPILVQTKSHLWSVEDGKISVVED